MDPFPFERLPIELKIMIIRFAIPWLPACLEKSLSGWISNNGFMQNTILGGMYTWTRKPWVGYSRERGPESSETGGPLSGACSTRWETLVTQEEPQEQTFAEMPFDSSLPIWPRTPMLKEFTLTSAVCGPDWHIDSFQQYGPEVSPRDWRYTPWISTHGYSSQSGLQRVGKWPGFRYWTETRKIEFRPLSWPEVQPWTTMFPSSGWASLTSAEFIPHEFVARLWINRPGEPIDAEQSQYGWIEAKAPEEGDDSWVEQVATTWKMVRIFQTSAHPNELNITSQDGDTSRTDRPQRAITEEAEPPLQKQVNSQDRVVSPGTLLALSYQPPTSVGEAGDGNLGHFPALKAKNHMHRGTGWKKLRIVSGRLGGEETCLYEKLMLQREEKESWRGSWRELGERRVEMDGTMWDIGFLVSLIQINLSLRFRDGD
ncbi:P-type ATPase (mediates high-affinity potassium or sodium uptake) [Fusarium globosum]|uniref:P-type ATPase (Mediates high-affinity potassium or sodium uptake) n=1 Tax=Fusarium globosum TaxID=78864 RepID=A0A8H6DI47_9HYPO|nr:P-type ATPase (mediates high-affinity potassium or sodium uptake) [Fusarium globosum]